MTARSVDVVSHATLAVRLLGHPLGHSISPAMQGAAFAHHRIAAAYELWDVAPEGLAGAVGALRGPNFLGANVTVPYKELVVPLLDELSPLAARAGAVNTIVKRGALLRGENTDIDGFLQPLRDRGADPAGLRATILGAGGAARAVATALLDAGVPGLTIANRTLARAEDLAAALATAYVAGAPPRAVALDAPALADVLAATSLLVDATAAGWRAGAPTLPPALLARLPATALVYDLTYRSTPLLRAAADRGLATIDGLPMLVEQGALAFELWTGRPAPRAVMREAALRARAE